MPLIKLDAKDKKILYQLEKDCRQPLSQLGKKVGLSREVVSYRIKQLEQKGIIQYYVAVIDYVRLGLMFCRLIYRYNKVSKDIEQSMVKFFQENPYVAWIAIGDGDINLGVVYITNNINLLQKHYYDFLLKYSNYIKSHSVSFALEIHHYHHSYLHGILDRTPLVVGKNKKIYKLDKVESAVLLCLLNNPRVRLLDISKSLNASIKTIKVRFENLKKEGIILGFKTKIKTQLLGFEHHKIFLYLVNLDKQKLKSLFTYLSQQNEVIFITIPMGKSQLEFELAVSGNSELYEFMNKLSVNCPDLIKDYDDVFFYREPFTNYMPNLIATSPH